jgi:hypothetical protein
MFNYFKNWTGEIIVAFAIASSMFSFIFLIFKYGFKKPLLGNKFKDRPVHLNLMSVIGQAVMGLGFGLGGLIFQSFLLTIPSAGIRTIVFWAIPCVCSMKATQMVS